MLDTPSGATPNPGGDPAAANSPPRQPIAQNCSPLAQQICRFHKEHDGSTFSLLSGNLRGRAFYAVTTVEEIVLTPELSELTVDEFIGRHYRKLSASDVAIGTWKDPKTGLIFISVTRLFADRNAALSYAFRRGERLIYGLEQCLSINVVLALNAISGRQVGPAKSFRFVHRGDLNV